MELKIKKLVYLYSIHLSKMITYLDLSVIHSFIIEKRLAQIWQSAMTHPPLQIQCE